jgi:hypothetical protein
MRHTRSRPGQWLQMRVSWREARVSLAASASTFLMLGSFFNGPLGLLTFRNTCPRWSSRDTQGQCCWSNGSRARLWGLRRRALADGAAVDLGGGHAEVKFRLQPRAKSSALRAQGRAEGAGPRGRATSAPGSGSEMQTWTSTATELADVLARSRLAARARRGTHSRRGTTRRSCAPRSGCSNLTFDLSCLCLGCGSNDHWPSKWSTCAFFSRLPGEASPGRAMPL